MNIIKSILLFLLMSLVPCLMLYLIFDGVIFKVVTVLFFVIWGCLYLYLDKLLLIQIKAREVVDTDQQFLFQCVKNEAYKAGLLMPKVYLYSGENLKCFVFQSRNEWSVVLDRKLMAIMDESQLRSIVSFLYKFRMSSICLVQTKVLGICSLFFTCVYWILKNIFFLNEGSKIFKVLSIFIFAMMRPLVLPLEMMGKRQKALWVDQELLPVYNQVIASPFTYNDYVLSHLLPHFSSKELIMNYLEGYPVLENCRFEENEFKETI